MSIVRDFEQLQTALFDDNLQRSGAGINSILDEFLKGMDRSDNDFSGSDLVHNIFVKCLGKTISLARGYCIGLLP